MISQKYPQEKPVSHFYPVSKRLCQIYPVPKPKIFSILNDAGIISFRLPCSKINVVGVKGEIMAELLSVGSHLSLRQIKVLSCKVSLLVDRDDRVCKSEATRFVLVCRYDKLCQYRITGNRKENDSITLRHTDDRFFTIRKCVLHHTCIRTGRSGHQKILPLTSTSLAASQGMLTTVSAEISQVPTGKRVVDEIRSQLDLTEGEMQELTKGSSIMSSVYRSSRKAKVSTVGNWAEGISQLEGLKERIEMKNDGTVLHIVKTDGHVYTASLIICGGTVEAMKLDIAPTVFSADFTFAKTTFGGHGQWWALSCPDAAGHIVPIAIGHTVENENKVSRKPCKIITLSLLLIIM